MDHVSKANLESAKDVVLLYRVCHLRFGYEFVLYALFSDLS